MMENLEHLPDDRREALIMRFALGMDNREIARALGRTDGATKVLITGRSSSSRRRRERTMTDVESDAQPTRCGRSSRRSGSRAG